MNYSQILEYLYNQLPFFQKQGGKALNLKLETTLALLDELGNPHQNLKCIHVAGTNGKGSTSHMLSAVLQAHNFKVGLYTSPHLKSFTERIKINGLEIGEKDVVEFIKLHKEKIDRLKPTFFEVTVAMAFWYFEKEKIDYAVIEVGMGGRLDSTNVIEPLVSVITNISMDHQQYLGDTLQKIAFEKGGIIKKDRPAVIGEIQIETLPVFQEIAKNKESVLVTELKNKGRLEPFLTGSYQDKNYETALKTIEVLEGLEMIFLEGKLTDALKNFYEIAGLKGRWQKLKDSPKIICDTGHNVAGITEVVKLIDREDYQNLFFVFGVVAEKDVDEVLNLLPKGAHYIFTEADNLRALPAEILYDKAQKFGLKGQIEKKIGLAISLAERMANDQDLIVIGGSTFVVAEIPFL